MKIIATIIHNSSVNNKTNSHHINRIYQVAYEGRALGIPVGISEGSEEGNPVGSGDGTDDGT